MWVLETRRETPFAQTSLENGTNMLKNFGHTNQSTHSENKISRDIGMQFSVAHVPAPFLERGGGVGARFVACLF